MKKERYDERYYVWVCPYCRHSKSVEIKNGFFNIKTLYECSKCRSKFEYQECLGCVAADPVTKIIQDGLNRKITTTEMIDSLKEVGIDVYYIPKKVKKK